MADELGQAQSIESAQGTIEKRSDDGEGKSGVVTYWKQQISLATKVESGWVKRASQTIDIYRDTEDRKAKRYNILYANTEVMCQAIYNSRAEPDVRARYMETDPVSKYTAMVLERALEYACDDSENDFDQVIKLAVKDLLLPGRPIDRVRYKPHLTEMKKRVGLMPMPQADGTTQMQRADNAAYLDPEDEWMTDDQGPYIDGDSYDQITYEECYVEHVQWADFRRDPAAKLWDEVSWIAFQHFLTRNQVEELNKKIGATIPLDASVEQDGKYKSAANGTAPAPDIFKRLHVWEVWDREKREVVWIAPSWDDEPLRTDEDPLGLAQFFPIPRPMYAIEVPETLVPTELYRIYKDQADELDTVSRRLTALTRAAKYRGIYAAANSGTTLTTLLQDAQDGDFVPAQEAMQAAMTQGGLGAYIWTAPIKEVVEAINLLTMRQQAVKQNIYEIMGIADILRGNSESRETATTSRVKAQWGSVRLQHLQQEVQRYVRDIFRLMAEIIAEKYQPQTLALITGLQIPPQVMEVLRSDALRSFRVDIETDSTIQADLQRFQENATQFIAGTAQFFAAIGPAVKEGAISAQNAIQIFQGFANMFKLPRKSMETIDNLQAPPQQQDQGQSAKSQAEVMRAQADMHIAQQDSQTAQIKGQVAVASTQQKAQLDAMKHGQTMQQMQVGHQLDMQKLAAQAIADRAKVSQQVGNA